MKQKTLKLLLLSFFLLFITNAKVWANSFSHYFNDIDTIFVKKKNQMIVRNSTKDTIEIAYLKNGKKNGKQILFYNNGDINKIAYYKDDFLNGKVEYYSRGRKAPFKVEYYKAFPMEQKSLLHGVSKNFEQDGKLLEKINYKNGKKNGKYELYYNDGKLKEKGSFRDDLNVGRKLYYNSDGVLLKDENFIIIDNPSVQGANVQPRKFSVLHGKVKYYHYNGLLFADLTFKNGKKEGACKEYFQDENNTLESKVIFKNGLTHGAFEYYHPNGNLRSKGIYYEEITVGDTVLKNVYDGTVEIYQNNGKKERIENWRNFKRNGIQEYYYYESGELSSRSHFTDNLKTGAEEHFDKEGNRTYLAYFEVGEKDGHKISQQTGTETYWENGKVKTTIEWKNGEKNGVSKLYSDDGHLLSIIHYKDNQLHGSYQTFYKNGQLKEDYNKQYWIGNGISNEIGWNTLYDTSGNIIRRFFALGNSKNIIEYRFENGKRKKLIVNDMLRINSLDTDKLSSILWGDYITLGYDLFNTGQLRKVYFLTDKYWNVKANFTSEGNVLQISNNGAAPVYVEDKKAIETAKRIAEQYNPKWTNEILVSDAFPDGKYKWNYADSSTFFEIEFKNNLPQGKWIMYNPILKDTLFYGEFNEGLPIGKEVTKSIEGIIKLRKEYHSNHELKERYYYGENGIISHANKFDSLGKEVFSEEYYQGGLLKSRSIPTEESYIYFSEKGDTLSYNLLFTKGDSIRIERQFFEGNKLKADRYNNLTSGVKSEKTYFENGQLQASYLLKDKEQHVVYQKFDEKGVLLTFGHFKDGKRDGEWINYKENGVKEILYFKEGKIIIKETEEETTCRCYDTSLVTSEIVFASLLTNLSDYKSIKPYIPKSIIPIDEWHYDRIFYINLRRSSGFIYFELLLFSDFSFHYPVENFLKFNLNPCRTEGYIGNIDTDIRYSSTNKELQYALLNTKRISVGLEKNPLVNAKDKSIFTAYFDTDHIKFNEERIESIQFLEETNDCYPLGLINNFMEIEIETAALDIHPNNRTTISNIPLLGNEIKRFYGFVINAATIKFDVDSTQIIATCDKIFAGANYVTGRLLIGGDLKTDNEFTLKNGKTVNINKLKKVLEQNNFYRVKIEATEHQLAIEFYAEK